MNLVFFQPFFARDSEYLFFAACCIEFALYTPNQTNFWFYRLSLYFHLVPVPYLNGIGIFPCSPHTVVGLKMRIPTYLLLVSFFLFKCRLNLKMGMLFWKCMFQYHKKEIFTLTSNYPDCVPNKLICTVDKVLLIKDLRTFIFPILMLLKLDILKINYTVSIYHSC